MSLNEKSTNKDVPAMLGENTAGGFGVFGKSDLGTGVHGENGGGNIAPDRGVGVWGESQFGFGLFGSSDNNEGIKGVSKAGVGVRGTNGAPAAIQPDRGCGVIGESIEGFGVFGSSDNHFGIKAVSKNGVGLSAEGATLAAFFRGVVEVTGDIRMTVGQDCAEDFDVAGTETIEAGTVMVIDQVGTLQQSEKAYDKRVAGVVSGAGDFKPAILLGTQIAGTNRTPIALLGKVYCKVDARYAPVEVGDLLTTSPTAGHAMKADDPFKAFGAVIGKALRPLAAGQEMIPILIALQ
jgi:hypothetical protein